MVSPQQTPTKVWFLVYLGTHCISWGFCTLPCARPGSGSSWALSAPKRLKRTTSLGIAHLVWDSLFGWVIITAFPFMNYIWSLNSHKCFTNVHYRERIPVFSNHAFSWLPQNYVDVLTSWLWLNDAVLKLHVCEQTVLIPTCPVISSFEFWERTRVLFKL